MARPPSPLPLPFHPDLRLVAEPDRALLCRPDDQQLRRGVHRSVRELVAAIQEFIAVHNETGKPYVWVKTADEILASIACFAQRTLQAHPSELSGANQCYGTLVMI